MWCPPTSIVFLSFIKVLRHLESRWYNELILGDCCWHNARWENKFSFSSVSVSGLPIRMWPTSVTPLGPESIVNIPGVENQHKTLKIIPNAKKLKSWLRINSHPRWRSNIQKSLHFLFLSSCWLKIALIESFGKGGWNQRWI